MLLNIIAHGTWLLFHLDRRLLVVVGPNGVIDRFKTRLVAKGYTQISGLDYGDTFSLLPKLTIVRLFFVVTIMALASPSITYPKCFSSW